MGRIKELDGLRVIAIFAVFMVHFRPVPHHIFDFTSLGWAGVDLFFAISGFLITSILIRLRGEERPFSTFYWRRTLRIFPPYYAALGVILLLAVADGEFLRRRYVVEAGTFLCSLDRLGNSLSLISGRLFSHAGFGVSAAHVASHHFQQFGNGISVFWSLSVEELFYLLWAPIILLGSRRTVLLSCIVPLFVCPVLRGLMHTVSFPEMFSFTCRFDSLAAGGCAALLFAAVDRGRLSVRILERGLILAIPISALAFLILSWKCGIFQGIEVRTTTTFSIFGYTLLAILFAALTGACAHWRGNVWILMLRWKPIAYLGTISYSMYLIHIPVYVAVGMVLRGRDWTYLTQILQGVSAVLVTIGIASLSWKYFESPLLQFRDRPFLARISPVIATQSPVEG